MRRTESGERDGHFGKTYLQLFSGVLSGYLANRASDEKFPGRERAVSNSCQQGKITTGCVCPEILLDCNFHGDRDDKI